VRPSSQPGAAPRDVTAEVAWRLSDADLQINTMGYGETTRRACMAAAK
jgi:hypothetical protein